MTAGKGPLRFRRQGYAGKNTSGDAPRWHRAARDTPKGAYQQLVALCGYTVAPSIALFLGYDLSTARVPKDGELCLKCEKVAADEAAYAERHPEDQTKKETK